MVDGFTDIDCTITIEKKGSAAVDFSADIFNFTETALERKIAYDKIIGGMILPTLQLPSEKIVTFNYITTDMKFQQLIDSSIGSDTITWDTINQYKVGLKFVSDGETFIKNYYDADILNITEKMNENVLEGEIKFSLPLKNIDGNSTYWVGTGSSNEATYDTKMGY